MLAVRTWSAATRSRATARTDRLLATFTFGANVSQGDSQRSILVARDDGSLPVPADFVSADLILPSSGAACFIDSLPLNGIDCVAFGTFAGFASGAPSPAGVPAQAPPPGGALQRSLAAGCATLLEAGDDTDDSAADFALATPSPRPNSAAPTETACTGGGGGADTDPPQTKIKKAPKGKIDADTVKVKFKSDEPNSSFECKFDRKPYKPCQSPKKLKNLDDGKHKFKVRATDAAGNTDDSPAKAKFKVVEDSARQPRGRSWGCTTCLQAADDVQAAAQERLLAPMRSEAAGARGQRRCLRQRANLSAAADAPYLAGAAGGDVEGGRARPWSARRDRRQVSPGGAWTSRVMRSPARRSEPCRSQPAGMPLRRIEVLADPVDDRGRLRTPPARETVLDLAVHDPADPGAEVV